MAFFKSAEYFIRNLDHAFDVIHPAGAEAPFSGIYRCEVCGHETVVKVGTPLPSEGHHPHGKKDGPICWRLIVASTHK